MKSFSVEQKISDLEKEISSLKTSQILGGDNTRVYKKYVEGESAWARINFNPYLPDDVYYSEDGSSGESSELIYFFAEEEDPFELVEIEKIEIWRNNFLLSGWSGVTSDIARGVGQRSSTGDLIRISVSQNYYTWQTGVLSSVKKRLGPMIIFDLRGGNKNDYANVTFPFKYTIKLWLRSTSLSEYVSDRGQ